MKELIKKIVPVRFADYVHHKKVFVSWLYAGQPVPPPHIVKQHAIRNYFGLYQASIFIETGTYMGAMVEAQKRRFKRVISIELAAGLYEKAKNRFQQDQHVEIIQGDSAKVLPQIMKEIKEPAICWLDGHYSGGETAQGATKCPVLAEVTAILSANVAHILLIDDARLFDGTGDYPTLEALIAHVKSFDKDYQVTVKDDIIRCVP